MITSKTVHIERILFLNDGETYFIDMGEESGGEVWLKNDTYFLFGVSQYGGNPMFVQAYPRCHVDDLVDNVFSWT